MTHEIATKVRAAAESSDLIRAVSAVREDGGIQFALGDAELRDLTAEEITQLRASGNWAEDWSGVRVAGSFDPNRISGCRFHGRIVLGNFTDTSQVESNARLPSGINGSTLCDCVVGHNALVQNVRWLNNYVVGPNAAVLNCGSVTCGAETSFGNGSELPIGLETGGREVSVFAEIDVEIAAVVAKSRSDAQLVADYDAGVQEYVKRATSQRGIIAAGAVVRDTSQVRDTFVGSHARIDGATLVSNTTLLSSEEEPAEITSGSVVKDSIVQWGSHVTTMAIVDHSVLTEHSHVERHGKLTESILGPNSGVAEGEATACLLGPFVGFHHQALLIAVLWPEGKGNVGYGANVGSNHTSKAPDQECWPGEGAFFGLGTNVKFPSNFSEAPYSIIATGVSALPQKVTFPFSLINSPFAAYDEISPAYNEIIPAWLLTDNIYTIKRNEGKYNARNKARRTQFVFDVFRPDTIDLMRHACRRLESVRHAKDLYIDRDIEGLGKNFMLETYREPAIEAYQFYIQYYALLGLKARVQLAVQSANELLTTESDDAIWEHQRNILHDELGETDVVTALRRLPRILKEVARDVEESKAKDDRRGQRIIDDYEAVHGTATDDKFVKQTWEETRRQVSEVESLIAQLT